MRYTIEINDTELMNSIVEVLVARTVETVESQLFTDDRFSRMRKMYKEDVQGEVRKAIKEHEPEILEKAIAEAGAIIARKAGAIVMGGVTFGKNN